MPSFRKMSPEEIAAVEESSVSSRKAIAELYDDLVRDLTEGDDIELELEPDERRQTVVARLKAAAARRQPALQLVFKQSDDPVVLHFMVPVLTPAPEVSPAPVSAPARPAAEPADLIDDQSQSLLNLRDTRDRRDYQGRNNRYDRRDRPHTNRPGTARVNRSNPAGRFQAPGRSSQPLSSRRNGPSPASSSRNDRPPMGGPRNDRPRNDGPRNDRPRNDRPRNDGPRNDGPRNDGPRTDRPRNDGPRNDRPRNDGPRNDRPRNDGPRNDRPRNDGPSPSPGPRDDLPTDRSPSASFNRQRQRRRPR